MLLRAGPSSRFLFLLLMIASLGAIREVALAQGAAGGQVGVELEGAPNFRDLGGYRTADGHVVKSNILFRSDALSDLTARDQAILQTLNIQRIVDFRGPEEISRAPDKLPDNLAMRHVSMPVTDQKKNQEPSHASAAQTLSEGGSDAVHAYMLAGYPNFVRRFTPIYREWLQGLDKSPQGAQVFHCTGGADRTGYAAAILLLSLGVSKDVVVQDYLATNAHLAAERARAVMKRRLIGMYGRDVPAPPLDPAYLEAAFTAMEQDYGSIEAYLRDGLGMDDALRSRLRARFLE